MIVETPISATTIKAMAVEKAFLTTKNKIAQKAIWKG